MKVEDRLADYGEFLEAAATGVSVEQALTTQPNRPRHTGARVVTAAAAVLLIAGAAWLVWRSDTATDVADDTTPDTADVEHELPPEALAPMSDEVELWLSAEAVPPGADLVSILRVVGGKSADYGTTFALEAWDGTTWAPTGHITMCIVQEQCAPALVPTGAPRVEIGAGQSTWNAGQSLPLRFSTSGLDEGWYRLRQEVILREGPTDEFVREDASGLFEVSADADGAAPLWTLGEPTIGMTPALLSVAGEGALATPISPIFGDATADLAKDAGENSTVRIESWSDDAWRPVAEVEVTYALYSLPPQYPLTLPQLEPGSYRVVSGTGADELWGNFWVEDESVDGSVSDAPTSAQAMRLLDTAVGHARSGDVESLCEMTRSTPNCESALTFGGTLPPDEPVVVSDVLYPADPSIGQISTRVLGVCVGAVYSELMIVVVNGEPELMTPVYWSGMGAIMGGTPTADGGVMNEIETSSSRPTCPTG